MIVGISGKARSGKDTFAEMLTAELNKLSYPPYIMMAFAHELKTRCQAAFDLSYEQLWGDEKEELDKRYPKPDTDTFWTAREIMQNYGAFYRSIDDHFWIKNLFKVAEEKEYKNVVITDVRYVNEAEYIQHKKGGYVIRITRKSKDDVHNMEHPSEVQLDHYGGFDYYVINDWGFRELEEAAKDVARFLKHSEIDLKKLGITKEN